MKLGHTVKPLYLSLALFMGIFPSITVSTTIFERLKNNPYKCAAAVLAGGALVTGGLVVTKQVDVSQAKKIANDITSSIVQTGRPIVNNIAQTVTDHPYITLGIVGTGATIYVAYTKWDSIKSRMPKNKYGYERVSWFTWLTGFWGK